MPLTMKALGIDQMTVEERLALVEEIWDSISAEPTSPPLTVAQEQDLRRRLIAYDADPKAGSPWEEVLARLESQP